MMHRTGTNTLAAAALLAVASLAVVSAQPVTTPLQPFTEINVCTPFNLVIGVSPTYQVIVDADAGVAAAVNATVENGVLTLSTNGNAPNALTFRAPNAIKVAVQLPADQLAGVAVSSVPSVVVAVAGFTVPGFAASLSGTSTLTALNMTADNLQLINQGTGTLLVQGKIGAAAITSSGTGTTYALGVGTSATVQAAGISKVYISGTPQTQITGQVSGISDVTFDQGVCTIGSEFSGIFGPSCTQEAITPPASLSAPQWSCAITVYGVFDCSAGGTTSSSSSTGGTSSSSSSSSSGGNGQTMTSQTINGVTTTSTGSSSPDGTSSLVTNSGTLQVGACPVTGAGLNIF